MTSVRTEALFTLRWSHVEASKAYARPFMVQFADESNGGVRGSVAVNGAELLYYRQFQAAVLHLTGELFTHQPTEDADDPQRMWLGALAGLLPGLDLQQLIPISEFDDHEGRSFRFSPGIGAFPWAAVGAAHLLEYQDVQAVLAHQTGSLYRNPEVEVVTDQAVRQATWLAVVQELLVEPPAA